MKIFAALLMAFLVPLSVSAKAIILDYVVDGVPHEGFLAIPDAPKENMPAVLIIHDWMGPSDYTQKKAQEMAALGYVAMAADIYGKAIRPKTPKEAGDQAGKYKNQVNLFRKKIITALDLLKKQKGVDSKKIIVFGYCFGGTGALELARTGADLAGVVSFHGGLKTATRSENMQIRTPILILHGAIDPNVPPQEVSDFLTDLDKSKQDYQFISYSGAVHAFTNPAAGNDPSKGAAYNAKADARSWVHFLAFLKEKAPAN